MNVRHRRHSTNYSHQLLWQRLVACLFDFVERIVRLVAFDNVASTFLLAWTGLYRRSLNTADTGEFTAETINQRKDPFVKLSYYEFELSLMPCCLARLIKMWKFRYKNLIATIFWQCFCVSLKRKRKVRIQTSIQSIQTKRNEKEKLKLGYKPKSSDSWNYSSYA